MEILSGSKITPENERYRQVLKEYLTGIGVKEEFRLPSQRLPRII
ncbi:hypothetical protein [Hungatella sp.]|nr:hypothetical protein [Hungatella sp.]